MTDTGTQIETTDAQLQRRLVAVALVGTAVAVWRGSNDAFAMPKLTVLAVAAVGIVAVGVWRILHTSQIALPRSWSLLPLGAFLGLGAVAVVTSDSTWRSFYGAHGRGTGYVLYLGGAVLLLGVLRSARPETAPRVVRAIVIGAAIVALYGVLQRVGVDPWDFPGQYGPNAATSTLGNTNFVSGYLGAVLPLALWAAITGRDRAKLWGIAAAVGLAACMVVARSQQGLVAAAAGLGVLGVGFIIERGGARRQAMLAALSVLAALAAAGVVLGMAGSGPLSRLHDTGVDYRRHYWSAALEMANDDPLQGVGFDRWGANYRAVRSEEAANVALSDTTDAPHSVPLNMFASGGYPLGIAYLAFVATIGISLLAGLRRTSGAQRLLLAAVGGSWVGYQVQSAVSIDVPALPVLHFVLAGLVLVLVGNVRWTTHVVRPLMRVEERRISKKNTVVTERPRLAGTPALVIAAIIGVLGLWRVTLPLRADIAIRDAQTSRDPQKAADHFRDALKLSDREAEYYSLTGEFFARQDSAAVALAFFEGALARDPRSFSVTLNAARAAGAVDDLLKATEYYTRALELEPHAVELKVEVGGFLARHGKASEGVELLREALEVRPGTWNWQLALGEALLVDGQIDEGREYLADVLASSPHLQGPYYVIDAFMAAELFDDARAIAEDLLEVNPADFVAKEKLARAAEGQGQNEEAAVLWDELATSAPGLYPDADVEALRLRAEASE